MMPLLHVAMTLWPGATMTGFAYVPYHAGPDEL
jgi:hypothetical protein